MKKLLFNLLIYTACSILVISCKKDEDMLISSQGAKPSFTSSVSQLTLVQSDADKDAVTFTWTATDFGNSSIAYRYILQLDKKGNNFAKPAEFEISESVLSKKMTVAEFNEAVVSKLQVTPGATADVEARVKAVALKLGGGNSSEFVLSDVKTINAKTYEIKINYRSLWIPGAYQGWSPDKAMTIPSVKDDGKYAGYIYFSTASMFKFASKPNWDGPNYGDGGAGLLSASGGDLNLPQAGYHWLTADLNAMTWSAEKRSWGLLGSATPTSWDSDTDMIYDPATNTLKLTLNLTVGKIKFRLNDDWGFNYGDGDDSNAPDGVVDKGGKDIDVAVAGNYTVTLDFNDPVKFKYTLKKN